METLWQVNLTTCVCTLLSMGDPSAEYNSDGSTSYLGFDGGVSNLQISPNGLFVLLVQNNKDRIRMYTFATNELTVLAGQWDVVSSDYYRLFLNPSYVYHSGLYVDDIGALACFRLPWGVTISRDSSYALVADEYKNVIRKIVIATASVTTLVGTGVSATVDGDVTIASFYSPMFIQLSPDNTYAVVTGNDWVGVIRMINLTTLSVSSLAIGAGAYSNVAFVQFAPGTPCSLGRYSPSGTEPCEVCTSGCSLGQSYAPNHRMTCCLPCDVCEAGVAYSSVGCTANDNTVCSACTTCKAGVTYTRSVCTPTANAVCSACNACVSGVNYTSSVCNISSNNVCSACGVCVSGVTYTSAVCSLSSNTVCSACDACVDGVNYTTSTCNISSNTVCSDCTVCEIGTYKTRNCSIFNNAVCSACNTTCNPGVTYMSSGCTPTANTICSACDVCLTGVNYAASRCNISSNTVCSNCTVCDIGTYLTGNCSTFNNTICTQCMSGMCLHICI